MKKNQQAFAVSAICLSIILAGVIIAYRPEAVDQDGGLPSGFRYPSGVGVSQGVPTLYGETATPTLLSDDVTQKTISLGGAGTASTTADEATINMGVEVTKDTAAEAISANAESMGAIIDALMLTGIGEDNIMTTSYSVYPQYDWTEDGRVLLGYMVTNMVQVTVKDLDIVGDVIDAAGGAGANRMDGISFGLSDAKMQELKNTAYILALGDATDKADLIADTLGLTISGVQSVTESSYVPARTNVAYAEAAMDSSASFRAPTQIISGDLSVSVNVHIVFLFQ